MTPTPANFWMCGKCRALSLVFLEVWQLKELRVCFSDLWQIKELVANDEWREKRNWDGVRVRKLLKTKGRLGGMYPPPVFCAKSAEE
jgi:hypothetical protein